MRLWAWQTTWRQKWWNWSQWYRFTYRYYKFMIWASLAFAAGSIWFGISIWYGMMPSWWFWWIFPIFSILAALWLFSLSCWFSPVFRYLALKVTTWVSRSIRRSVGKKRLLVVLGLAYLVAEDPPRFLPLSEIVGMVGSADLASLFSSVWVSWRATFQALDLNYVLKACGVVLLFGAIYWLFWSKPRMDFDSFGNNSGNEKLDGPVNGLPSLLANRLTQLNRLFRVIDEARPEETGHTIEPLIAVGGTIQYLKDFHGDLSIGAPSTLQFSVRINTLIRTLRKVTRGSMLGGSVAKDGDCLVISAEFSDRRKKSWQVRQDKLKSEALSGAKADISALLPQMAEELVFRIFTDLVDVGSPRWKAVRHYSNGLRLYRDTMLTRTNREVNLRKAEKEFLKALEEDEEFAICWYNLGIVYKKLKAKRAAEAAFMRAAEENPLSRDAYFGLASMALEADRFKECIHYCDRVIRLRSRETRAWEMKGLALRKLEDNRLARRMTPGDPDIREFWERSLPTRSIATALAWRTLCFASTKRQGEARHIAAVCTNDLAVAFTYLEKRRPALRQYYQAIHLDPSDYDFYLEAGAVHMHKKDWNNAIDLFQSGLGVAQAPQLWSMLSYTMICKVMGALEYNEKRFTKASKQELRKAIDYLWRALRECSNPARITLEYFLKSLSKLIEIHRHCKTNSDARLAHLLREIESLNEFREWGANRLLQQLIDQNYLVKAKDYVKDLMDQSLVSGASTSTKSCNSKCWSLVLSRLKEIERLRLNWQEKEAQNVSKKAIADLKKCNDVDCLGNKKKSELKASISKCCCSHGTLSYFSIWRCAHELRQWVKKSVLGQPSAGRAAKPSHKKLKKAQRFLKWAIKKLEPHETVLIRELGLRRQLSEVYLCRGNLAGAALAAEHSVQEDVESPKPRHALAGVLWVSREYCKALSEWELCLSLEPDSELLARIVKSLDPLVINEISGSLHLKSLKRIARILDQIHQLLESRPLDSQKDKKDSKNRWFEERSLIHERLGLIHFMLGEHEVAYRYLAIARAMDPKLSKEVRGFLGAEIDRLGYKKPEVRKFRSFTR